MFSNATNVLRCRHRSRCSFAVKESAILILKTIKCDCRVGLGVFAKCLICAQITLDACFLHCALTGGGWPLLECPTERKIKHWPIILQFVSKLWAYWERKHTGLWKPSGAWQWAPIWKLQAWGILKCTPEVDICHLAPGIIRVGIWHGQQCWSSNFVFEEEEGHIFLICPHTHLS